MNADEPWTLLNMPGDRIVTVVMVISGDDIATLMRSKNRAVGHDDEKQVADFLRRLSLALEDRHLKLYRKKP